MLKQWRIRYHYCRICYCCCRCCGSSLFNGGFCNASKAAYVSRRSNNKQLHSLLDRLSLHASLKPLTVCLWLTHTQSCRPAELRID